MLVVIIAENPHCWLLIKAVAAYITVWMMMMIVVGGVEFKTITSNARPQPCIQ